MFGIGFTELLVVAVVALVFVGPKKLPELMKQFGKFFVQARRMTSEVRSTMDTVIRDAENELQREELEKVRTILENAKNEAEGAAKKIIDVEPYEHEHEHHHDHHQNALPAGKEENPKPENETQEHHHPEHSEVAHDHFDQVETVPETEKQVEPVQENKNSEKEVDQPLEEKVDQKKE